MFPMRSAFFFFNDTATTEIYTLSLHDALPISAERDAKELARQDAEEISKLLVNILRSEEHTSELQSHSDLVCRLLLDKKRTTAAAWHCSLTRIPCNRADQNLRHRPCTRKPVDR